uniref:Uncharacterized protein n=1 Tax=Cryptomonas curvata TaxID=233186 RepID=A0A7S0M9Y7_9CRYP
MTSSEQCAVPARTPSVEIQSSASFAVNGNMGVRNISSHSSFELSSMLAAWVDKRHENELHRSQQVHYQADKIKDRGCDELKWSDRELLSMESSFLKEDFEAPASRAEEQSVGNYLDKVANEIYPREPSKRNLDDPTEYLFTKFQRTKSPFSRKNNWPKLAHGTDDFDRIEAAVMSQSFNAHQFSMDDLTLIAGEIFLQVILYWSPNPFLLRFFFVPPVR